MQGMIDGRLLLCGSAAAALAVLWRQALLGRKGYRPGAGQQLALAAFTLYLAAVFALTVSPAYGYGRAQFARQLNLTPLRALAGGVANLWGNVALFVPAGLLLCLAFVRLRSLWRCLLAGAALSAGIEICQLFCTRATDLDDLLLNILGTAVGWTLGRLALGLLPALRRCACARPRQGGKALLRDGGALPAAVLLAVAAMLGGWAWSAGVGASTGAETIAPAALAASAATPSYTGEVEATAAILVDGQTGQTLYEKQADLALAPASTTKLLAALTAWDVCSPTDTVTAGDELTLVAQDASRAGLQPGSQLTVTQLLQAMLLPSGNDAAYTLAAYAGRRIGGQALTAQQAVDAFVAAMNEKAQTLGALNAHFTTPDGYDAPAQYATARDLARIGWAFWQAPALAELAAAPAVTDTWLSGEVVQLVNTNLLLDPASPYYDPCVVGLKTGHTGQAGYCLVCAAQADGQRYLTVVLGSSENGRWQDTLALLGSVGA